ncbi:MAG: hypothetical protein AAGH83_09335 [Pseudomonadota bacterium]
MTELSPATIYNAIALILWCYAGILGVAWFRAVGHTEAKMHVAHFVSLMGVMVPFSASLIAVIMISAMTGWPLLLLGLAIFIPAGLVITLQLEVSRLIPSTHALESQRLLATLGLFALILAWRGGV